MKDSPGLVSSIKSADSEKNQVAADCSGTYSVICSSVDVLRKRTFPQQHLWRENVRLRQMAG